jgi:hypothetical protein
LGGRTSLALLALAAGIGACASGGARDTVPESHDVRVLDAGAPAAQGDYEYVARRPLAIVGLVGERNMDLETAKRIVDRTADLLDACATGQAQKGQPHEGAARVVVQVNEQGVVEGMNVKYDPGSGVPESAGVCLLSPLQMMTFPPAAGDKRKFALEALWGSLPPSR